MIIIHAVNEIIHPRALAHSLQTMLRIMPAVVVTGARQTGKSTLAQAQGRAERSSDGSGVGFPGRRYLSLDDLDVLDLARKDPDALVRGTRPVTLDEVQREPGLMQAVKRAQRQSR